MRRFLQDVSKHSTKVFHVDEVDMIRSLGDISFSELFDTGVTMMLTFKFISGSRHSMFWSNFECPT